LVNKWFFRKEGLNNAKQRRMKQRKKNCWRAIRNGMFMYGIYHGTMSREQWGWILWSSVNRTDYKRLFALHYITLHYTTLRYVTLRYITLQYNTIQYNTIQYNTIQYITLHYIKLQYITLHAHVVNKLISPRDTLINNKRLLIHLKAIWKRCVSSDTIYIIIDSSTKSACLILEGTIVNLLRKFLYVTFLFMWYRCYRPLSYHLALKEVSQSK